MAQSMLQATGAEGVPQMESSARAAMVSELTERGSLLPAVNFRLFGKLRHNAKPCEVRVLGGRTIKAKQALRLSSMALPFDKHCDASQLHDVDAIVPTDRRHRDSRACNQRLKTFTMNRVFPSLKWGRVARSKSTEKGIVASSEKGSVESVAEDAVSSTERSTARFVLSTHRSHVLDRPVMPLDVCVEKSSMERVREMKREKDLMLGPQTITATPQVPRHVDVLPFGLGRTEEDKKILALKHASAYRLAALGETYRAKARRFQRKWRARSPMPVLRQIAYDQKRQAALFINI